MSSLNIEKNYSIQYLFELLSQHKYSVSQESLIGNIFLDSKFGTIHHFDFYLEMYISIIAHEIFMKLCKQLKRKHRIEKLIKRKIVLCFKMVTFYIYPNCV